MGELSYEINIEIILPKITERIEFPISMTRDGCSIVRALRIPNKNPLFERNLQTVIELRVINGLTRLKVKNAILLLFATPYNNNQSMISKENNKNNINNNSNNNNENENAKEKEYQVSC